MTMACGFLTSAWFLRVSLLSGRAHYLQSSGPKPQPDLRLAVGVEASGAGVPTDPLREQPAPMPAPGICPYTLIRTVI